MACQLACNLISGSKFDVQLRSQLNSQLDSQLNSQLHSQLHSQLRSQLNSQLDSQLRSQLDSQIYSQIYSQLRSQLRSQLHSQLNSQLLSQLNSQKIEYFYETQANNWWYTGYYAFYDFVLNVLMPDKKSDFQLFEEFLGHFRQLHKSYFFEDLAIISDFPKEIHIDVAHRMHHETQAALIYRDTYSLYSLNGVQVPAWAIETPKDQIQAKDVLAITHTEQRMAVMKHVGHAYFLEALGAREIDRSGTYRLYYVTVEGREVGPYLYMECPSSGRKFLEGVGDSEKNEFIDPTIKTCADALKWRMAKASNDLMTKFTMKWQMHA
jgi:hypothetical protein